MVELESFDIPILVNKVKCWKRYVDGSSCYIRFDSVNFVLSKFNSFHKDIQFTVETEKDCRISFLYC